MTEVVTFQSLVDMADVERRETKKRYITVQHYVAGDERQFKIVSNCTPYRGVSVVCYINEKRVARAIFESSLADAQGVEYTGKREPETTCQICACRHEMVGGLIAHHGYTRPGGGYQTASCWGARHLPYELSCDMLPGWIDTIKERLAQIENTIAQHNAKKLPIARASEKVADGWRNGRRQYKWVHHPDWLPGDTNYESYRNNFLNSMNRSAAECASDIAFLEDRVKNWVLKEIKA